VLQLRDRVGEFEKPQFFHYKPKLCAHSRNEQIGCTACIDVCSAQAIRSDAR
jgi:ferredoxin